MMTTNKASFFMTLVAATAVVVVTGYDEIGFAQAKGDEAKGCFGLQSTFVRTGNNVSFDQGTGTFDAATNKANFTYTEPDRTSGSLAAKDGGLMYTINAGNGTSCSYNLTVEAGSFLGVKGAAPLDNAGVVKATFDESRSNTTFACSKTVAGPFAVITSGNFAAAGGRVGSYDAATKKAIFVNGFDSIFVVSTGTDGKALTADLQTNAGKVLCAYKLEVTEGKAFGVQK